MSEVKDYVDLRIDELKLSATKGFSLALGRIFAGLLIGGVTIIVLGLLCVVLIHWIAELTGSLAVASSIVCGVFLIALVVLISLRKRLFRDSFVKLFVKVFFEDDK
jgi:hypothetical protein